MKFRSKWLFIVIASVSLLQTATIVNAEDILIVNGTSTTSEGGTTATITATLNGLLQSQGHTTTISDPVPADVSAYDQVWDIRFSPAIAPAEQAEYTDFLNNGGNLFIMGENAGFPTRNNSVLALIQAAGGGSLSFVSPASVQNVNILFRTPNDIDTVSYCAPGGAAGGGVTAGNGIFLSDDGVIGGTALGFPRGSLVNAPSGSLAVVFDVNFMQPCGTNAEEFLENLSGFVLEGGTDPSPPSESVPVPTISQWAMISMILLLGLVAAGQLRRRIQ